MKKDEVGALIRKIGIIPAIRVSNGADAHFAAEAVTHGGIPIVEITMTVPGALDLISHLVKHDPKTLVGAGTVLDIDTARRCADALGIPTRSTLGLVLIAKKRGVLPAARPIVERLRQAGMYLSDDVMNRDLEMVGE